jgi:Cu/Ag efflux protein CusF
MTLSVALTAIALAMPGAHAQQTPAPAAATAQSSSPGKYSASAVVEATARVTAIDKATRTVTLQGAQGRVMDVVAGDEVKNFDQIRLGDTVSVQYVEALTLELKKTQGTPGVAATGAAVRAEPGQRPAGAVGRQVVVLADVVAVDQAKSTISLKGPRGNVIDLKVKDQSHFKVVKTGDQVEAVYTEAVAIEVKPAPKPAAKK